MGCIRSAAQQGCSEYSLPANAGGAKVKGFGFAARIHLRAASWKTIAFSRGLGVEFNRNLDQ